MSDEKHTDNEGPDDWEGLAEAWQEIQRRGAAGRLTPGEVAEILVERLGPRARAFRDLLAKRLEEQEAKPKGHER